MATRLIALLSRLGDADWVVAIVVEIDEYRVGHDPHPQPRPTGSLVRRLQLSDMCAQILAEPR